MAGRCIALRVILSRYMLLDFLGMTRTLPCIHCASGYVLSFPSFDFSPYLSTFMCHLVCLYACTRSIPPRSPAPRVPQNRTSRPYCFHLLCPLHALPFRHRSLTVARQPPGYSATRHNPGLGWRYSLLTPALSLKRQLPQQFHGYCSGSTPSLALRI